MKYLVLARRYRPQSFKDVYGQEAVVTTLKNALRFKRVGHAYLFCGSRGVGKTTIARLFAKALNCSHLSKDFEPCNQCPSCLEILSGQSLDVIEIDGASNRGIDDIRTLNETVNYSPSHGSYKIYIIDEVHMLTKEAFNALLKTLEEPPSSAKFFFATTEIHKVPSTILSRCQRFELRRLTESHITNKLLGITNDLKREISLDAISLIAEFSEGAMRDAESLLDQILCFSEGAITRGHVQSLLGLVPEEVFFTLDQAFSEGNISYAFLLVEQLFQEGKDLVHFTEQLIRHFRRLAIFQMLPCEREHLPPAMKEKIQTSLAIYTHAQLLFILDLALSCFPQIQKSTLARVCLEALLLQILRSKNLIPIETIVRKLGELEESLSQEKTCEEIPLQKISPLPQPTLHENLEKPVATTSAYTSPTNQSLHRHETIMRFAAVELEGTLKK